MTGFTDRSRTSGEYLLGLAMGLFLKQRTLGKTRGDSVSPKNVVERMIAYQPV